jgi:hypothetical protein
MGQSRAAGQDERANPPQMSSQLTQRKKNTFADDPFDEDKPNGPTSPDVRKDKRARDPNEVFDSDEEKDGKAEGKLTLMEEIVLLGMKDDQVRCFKEN